MLLPTVATARPFNAAQIACHANPKPLLCFQHIHVEKIEWPSYDRESPYGSLRCKMMKAASLMEKHLNWFDINTIICWKESLESSLFSSIEQSKRIFSFYTCVVHQSRHLIIVIYLRLICKGTICWYKPGRKIAIWRPCCSSMFWDVQLRYQHFLTWYLWNSICRHD